MELMIVALSLFVGLGCIFGRGFTDENDAQLDRELKNELLKKLKEKE